MIELISGINVKMCTGEGRGGESEVSTVEGCGRRQVKEGEVGGVGGVKCDGRPLDMSL